MDVNRLGLAAVVLGMIVVTGGCSEQEGAAEAVATQQGTTRAAIIDPCQLISKEQAEKIMGSRLVEGPTSERKAVGLKICLYEPQDLTPGLFQVSLTQEAFMSEKALSFGQNPITIFNTTKENFPQRTQVEGIGDEAFIAPPGLHIRYRGYYLVIAVGNTSSADNRAKLELAGRSAVASLAALVH